MRSSGCAGALERLEAELDRARLVITAQGNLSALLEGLLAESAQDPPEQ